MHLYSLVACITATLGQPSPTLPDELFGCSMVDIWLGPTNGMRPYTSDGSSIDDKDWFRIVENPNYDPGVVTVRFDSIAGEDERAAAHLSACALEIVWESEIIPGVIRVIVPAGLELEAINSYLDNNFVLYAEPVYPAV